MFGKQFVVCFDECMVVKGVCYVVVAFWLNGENDVAVSFCVGLFASNVEFLLLQAMLVLLGHEQFSNVVGSDHKA